MLNLEVVRRRRGGVPLRCRARSRAGLTPAIMGFYTGRGLARRSGTCVVATRRGWRNQPVSPGQHGVGAPDGPSAPSTQIATVHGRPRVPARRDEGPGLSRCRSR